MEVYLFSFLPVLHSVFRMKLYYFATTFLIMLAFKLSTSLFPNYHKISSHVYLESALHLNTEFLNPHPPAKQKKSTIKMTLKALTKIYKI